MTGYSERRKHITNTIFWEKKCMFVAWNGVITLFSDLPWGHLAWREWDMHGDAHAEHPVHQRAGTLRPRVADPRRTSREGPEQLSFLRAIMTTPVGSKRCLLKTLRSSSGQGLQMARAARQHAHWRPAAGLQCLDSLLVRTLRQPPTLWMGIEQEGAFSALSPVTSLGMSARDWRHCGMQPGQPGRSVGRSVCRFHGGCAFQPSATSRSGARTAGSICRSDLPVHGVQQERSAKVILIVFETSQTCSIGPRGPPANICSLPARPSWNNLAETSTFCYCAVDMCHNAKIFKHQTNICMIKTSTFLTLGCFDWSSRHRRLSSTTLPLLISEEQQFFDVFTCQKVQVGKLYPKCRNLY